MLGAWLLATRGPFPATSVRAWKLPGSTSSRSSALWTAWIFPQMKFHSDSCSNSLNGMAIGRKRCGRWTNRRELWIAGPCSAIRSRHWIGCRPYALSFANNYRPVPTLEQLNGSVRKALNPKQAYHMVPGRDPDNV